MIYISLPWFYKNFKFNEYIHKYILDYPDSLKVPIQIEYVYGSIPWSYWNGNINNHSGHFILKPELINIMHQSSIPIRLDNSNIYLQEKDFYDTYENVLISCLQKNHISEISDINLLSYIAQLNPQINFIISENINILNNLDQCTFELLLSQDYIKLISLIELPKFEIKNKDKIELIIHNCSCDKEQYLECKKIEQACIYSYSSNSVIVNCRNTIENIDYLEEILAFYKQGYSHFKIQTNIDNIESFNLSFMNSFIKSECIGECLYGYYSR